MLKKFLKYIVFSFIQKDNIYEFLLKKKSGLFTFFFKLCRREIIFLDTVQSIKTFEKEIISDIYTPLINNMNQESIKVVAPAVKLYSFENAIVNIHSSNFISNTNVIIERIPSIDLQYCNYATGAVVAHNSKNAFCKKINLNSKHIDNGIFLGGNGSNNYYHWMTEILPKIDILRKNNILNLSNNIIISDEVKTIDSFMRTLQEAFRGVEINLLFLNPLELYMVNKLYVISALNNIVFNSKEIITSAKYCFYRIDSFSYVRDLVLNMIYKYDQTILISILDKLKNKEGKVNIFLARKKGSARIYNQNEIIKVLSKEFNIKLVYIEDYNIEEQAFIFSKANLIIGASGAAWTNLIFSRSSTIAISWIPQELRHFSVFSTIAYYYEVKKYFIESNLSNGKDMHSDYEVSIDKLRLQLKSLEL